MRRFAEDTSVPISRSRGEIDQLLRAWGAQGIQWTDDFEHDRVMLRFVWPRGEQHFMARFAISLQGREELKEEAKGVYGTVREAYLEKLMQSRGKREHRVLLLWLKAALNAVDSGLIDAETIFLPFLEDRNGKTIAEIALPRLGVLLEGSANRLLEARKG
jgi:hypothetical protein